MDAKINQTVPSAARPIAVSRVRHTFNPNINRAEIYARRSQQANPALDPT